ETWIEPNVVTEVGHSSDPHSCDYASNNRVIGGLTQMFPYFLGDETCWENAGSWRRQAQRGGSAGLDVAELELASSMTGGILLPELEMTGNATAEVTQGFGAIELLDDHFQTAARAAAAPAPAAASSAVATTEATTAAAAETDAAGDGAESRAAAGPASGGADAGGLKVVRTGDAYLDLDTFVQDNVLEPDQATLHHTAAYMTAEEPEDVIVRTRSYDLSITYDKYYQTPRIWLLGYDELQQGLNGEQMFEDVMQDYARQTVTIEPHPHLETYHASVHPCRHAAVMKRIVENLTRGGKEARVDQYLFIFLKFVQSVIPTVNYDHTMDVDT
ncbi:unnamed protein product, partial [Phaeothamnion confervicola]